jgi:hypothetical protein
MKTLKTLVRTLRIFSLHICTFCSYGDLFGFHNTSANLSEHALKKSNMRLTIYYPIKKDVTRTLYNAKIIFVEARHEKFHKPYEVKFLFVIP